MRHHVVLAAVALTVLAAVNARAADPGFGYGVAVSDVGPTGASFWTRAPRSGSVLLEVSSTGRFVEPGRPGPGLVLRTNIPARRSRDLTVDLRFSGLEPGRRYWYRFGQGGSVSPVGVFETAPRPSAGSAVRFALSGDADATPGRAGKPAYNRYEVYGRMAAERNDFNVNLGDTIYSDSEVGGAPFARTLAQKWAKYRLGLALPALRRLRASAALYSHWDDHEFVNDFSPPEHGGAIYGAGARAFLDYAPVYAAGPGIFRTFRWGRHLELFFLDERSFRSGKATAACGGDLAPTLPQAVRDAFAALAPALRNPVPPACLAAISDPTRTILGARQYAAFTRAIARSTATWKVVVNEVPIQQYYALPYDRWEGYAAERERLLRFLQANARNVVFLTTDSHANFVNEVRHRTLGASPESSGIWEVVTGPVATNTFSNEIDSFLGAAGAAAAIGAIFFKPPPPSGMGMRCAALDTYSYAQVTVRARTLTVALKDARGRPVREARGTPCAPLVLRAR